MSDADERVVGAPCAGLFEPQQATVVTTEGEVVYEGQQLGAIRSDRGMTCVVADATGFLEMLHPGGSVQVGEVLAVVRS